MPDNREVVLLSRIYAPALAELKRTYTVHEAWAAADPDAFIRASCAHVTAAATASLIGCNRERMASLPNLKLIACFGTPKDSVDYAAAKARGIVITNTPDAITEQVADLAVGLLIAVMRRIPEGDRFIRAGGWDARLPVPGRDLRGKTCGIVGFGRIGRGVAARLAPFGVSLRYHGPRRKDDSALPYHADVEDLARACDCLIVCCPEMPATRNLVTARVLDALGADGFLVNVSRGSVVDEPALIAALQAGRIAGAALDVFRNEPRVAPELRALDNVVMTPHVGSSTLEVREERRRKFMANLRAHFAGEAVPYPFSSPR